MLVVGARTVVPRSAVVVADGVIANLSVDVDVPARFARGIVVGIRTKTKREVHQLLSLFLALFADGLLKQTARGEMWLVVQPLSEVV